MFRIIGPVLFALSTASSVLGDEPVKRPDPARWADAMETFAEKDRQAPPSKGQILFLGSSSIRLWDTEKFFPKLTIINRGFGGSWIQDAIHHADQIVFPYAPKTIVLYAGDNDVGGGLSADAVLSDYLKFVGAVREQLPETKIIFIAIKPSLKRWNRWPTMKEANDAIAKRCQEEPLEQFANIAPLLLGEDGKPDAAYFADDGLHLNDAGYERWTALLRTLLAPEDAKRK